ncbi:MAG TPA: hypothetical protein VKA53_05650 [Thermoanaerobaculia bacterium]|nr:hypothetical protein [Thermoanaerobaculia bacterium]
MSTPRVIRLLKRIPGGIPLFGALAAGGSFLFFSYSRVFWEEAIGRPYSTSCFNIVTAPVFSVFLALAGFLIGGVVYLGWKPAARTAGAERRETWVLIISLLTVTGIGSWLGLLWVVRFEARALPGVLVDTGAFERVGAPASGPVVRKGSEVYVLYKVWKPVSWGGHESRLRFYNDAVEIIDPSLRHRPMITTQGLDYTIRIVAAPVREASGTGLVLMVRGRATGDRAIIAVVDPHLDVLYEERVKVCWGLDDDPVEVHASGASSPASIVIGPSCAEPIVLAPTVGSPPQLRGASQPEGKSP